MVGTWSRSYLLRDDYVCKAESKDSKPEEAPTPTTPTISKTTPATPDESAAAVQASSSDGDERIIKALSTERFTARSQVYMYRYENEVILYGGWGYSPSTGEYEASRVRSSQHYYFKPL